MAGLLEIIAQLYEPHHNKVLLKRLFDMCSSKEELEQSIQGIVESLQQLESSKQNVLKAGVGISIVEDLISCTLDTNPFKAAPSLPSTPPAESKDKIWIIPSPNAEEKNNYEEWYWKVDEEHPDGYWEKIGDSKLDVDMTLYQTKEDEELQTQEKTIVGAINEVDSGLKSAVKPYVVNLTSLLAAQDSESISTAIGGIDNLNGTVQKNQVIFGTLANGTVAVGIRVLGNQTTLTYFVDSVVGLTVNEVIITNTSGTLTKTANTHAVLTENMVVDNLESDETTLPLSAAQGKVLGTNKQDKTDESLQTSDKTVAGAINEINTSLAGINGEDIDINALDVVQAFPNNIEDTYVWYIGGSTYLGTFIRVFRGIKLSITGNASATTSYCFVKEIGEINGEEVKFASSSTLISIEWGKTISIVAPEDAVYLWVSMGTRVPQGISIEGSLADVLHVSNIVNNLHDGGSDKVLSAEQGKTLNDKIKSIPLKPSQEYTIENVEVVRHYADNNEWIIDYMPSEYTGCYIPVKGGDVFTIVASDTNAIYAFIKSKGVNNGDNVDFAGDATSTTIIKPNVQKMLYAPDDAEFLWICVKYNNNNRFPKSLIKEGDKVQTIGKWNLHNITENPIEVINTDGGFARIFKNWGFIGDSMTSGNHNYYNKNGTDVGGDIFEYSWGEYIKQILGCDGYEYSTGGWTCRDWIDATNGRGWDKLQNEKRQVYTIALGCNDASPEVLYPLGSPSDIQSNYNQNADTFYGNYAGIIQRIKSIQPKAVIFCITLPSGDRDAAETYNAAIRYMAEKFSNVYIIDLYKYAPPVNDEWGNTFRNRYHLNAMGYLYTAWEILTYIDWIIRKNPLYFRDVAFIGDDDKFVTQDSNVYGNNGLR